MVDLEGAFGPIWGKATGGRSVAVDPNMNDADAFTVAPAPGVREACDWLREGLDRGGPQRLVFLVGGPGGGKSHALAHMTADLEEDDAEDTGLAQRKYVYRAGQSRLVVVNDASIRGANDRHPLADDVDSAVGARDYFLGCVNRGILVEEAHALGTETVGASIVRWLADVDGVATGFQLTSRMQGPLVSRAELHLGDRDIEFVAVYVDHCSLFEVRPQVDEALCAQPYRVKRLKQRATLDTLSTPAGSLLSLVAHHLSHADEPPAPAGDPLAANIASFQSVAVQRGFLTLLRSAEAVAGARMTFREVWGAIMRAMAGDLPQMTDPQALATMFPLIDEELNPAARFAELRHRARLRASQAIVGADLPSEVRATDPVLRITALVDPVLDAVPGSVDDPHFGWASPVLAAFSGLITAYSPLKTILESIPDHDPFREAVTDFDRALDDAFVAVTQPEGVDDKTRREIVAWYGDYLSRLYAVANGVSAFRQEVSAWLETRSSLPSAVKTQLKTLLRPSRDPNDPQSGYLLPLFSSRTVPLTGPSAEPQLVLQGEDDVQLELVFRGDSVTVNMRELGILVGEIELDFALIRTVQSCANQRLGVTEQAARVSPRVERFRAKRLIPERVENSEFRVITGQALTDLYVETS
ncbi:hypothetical protein RKE38_11955 [Phycicoccus sp. M110.8]|uniref:hypothetical protein n=1 Tax=Phycicoccus sp. M110.8 TaxID=3075433 RepID=UPI0028FDB519|nr:hypothetical protein [Phycicoccus sp. M110.8]MDU0314404.1 hypothetical protein [Phycicoccus sp. M110.8]